jgi:hypothetical protein
MKGVLLTLRPDRTGLEEMALTAPPAGETLRDIVGGDVEAVPYFHTIEHDGEIRACIAFCIKDGIANKDDARQDLLVNEAATSLWDRALRRASHPDRLSLMRPDGQPAAVLVGTIAVVIGDRAFLRALEGGRD